MQFKPCLTSLCNLGWPQTLSDPPASASLVLGHRHAPPLPGQHGEFCVYVLGLVFIFFIFHLLFVLAPFRYTLVAYFSENLDLYVMSCFFFSIPFFPPFSLFPIYRSSVFIIFFQSFLFSLPPPLPLFPSHVNIFFPFPNVCYRFWSIIYFGFLTSEKQCGVATWV